MARIAIVTGGTRGLGAAISTRISRRYGLYRATLKQEIAVAEPHPTLTAQCPQLHGRTHQER